MFIINELLTTVTYTGNGTQTNFDIPFDYLRKSFVFATINNEATSDFTIDGRTLIFNEAPAEEAIIVIYRKTDTKPLVSWADASVFRSGDMTISQVQQLHIIEEGQDWSRTNSVVLEDDVYNMRFHRVTNVADPQYPQDVVTKNYMETVQGGFVQQNQALVQQATQQAGIATTKAGEANTSASAAKTSETNAQKWAESSDSPDGQTDSESPTGDTMSAKEWALYAKDLALAIGNPVTSTTESNGIITVQKSDGTKNTINIVTGINGKKGAITNMFDTTTEQTVDVKKIFRQLYLKNTDTQNEGGELKFIYSKNINKTAGLDLFHLNSQNPALRIIDYSIMTDSTRVPFYFWLDGNIKSLLGDADFIVAKAFSSTSSYIKYASGKQEVWMRVTSTGNDTTVNLPVSFKTAVCLVSPWGSSANVFGAKFVETNKVQVYVPQGLSFGLYVVGEAA